MTRQENEIMTRAIVFGGILAIVLALGQVACAQETVELIPVQVAYTLAGQSGHELYHDAIAVCHEADQSCEVLIDDAQAYSAWRLPLSSCLTRAVVWSERLDEPAAVLGCENAAYPTVLVVDRGSL